MSEQRKTTGTRKRAPKKDTENKTTRTRKKVAEEQAAPAQQNEEAAPDSVKAEEEQNARAPEQMAGKSEHDGEKPEQTPPAAGSFEVARVLKVTKPLMRGDDVKALQTALIEREKMNGGTHDMGFKVYCSFGNGYRLTGDVAYKDVLLQAAYTLTTRYKEGAGIIRSWDHSRDKWDCPVIIDNMMNLELLFWAFRTSGDSLFYNVAVNHARTTMKNHFRDDYSSYHVVDYDTITGAVLHKHTHQGYAHESAWSRGQAWGLYGYTVCYRETGLPEFLEQAKHIENYIFSSPTLPEDLVPYWDFNAPGIPNEPRDASAATVTASALYELSMYDPAKRQDYITKANTILENLSANYRAAAGKDRGFLLLHSTGSKMHNVEVDVPIVYADYYYLEALKRYKDLKEKSENPSY